ncbi:major allergen Pru av 1 [Ricinus communis]|uniref:major allergen Pru av 1 n=1 Tax=Ricinus communis TaxID=3988 RepID=UPI00201B2D11|nr:major allergen Pru av 1 [Ricinus communis]
MVGKDHYPKPVIESDTLIPKILPQINIEFLESNGGPGTIKKTTYNEAWIDELEKTSYEIKVVDSFDGGSIIKNISKYYPKEGCKLNEERTKAEAVKAFGKFKIIETYVLTNLDAC